MVEKPAEALPAVQKQPVSMGLPSIGSRGGNFQIDEQYLKKATMELNKLNEITDFEQPKPVQEDNRSMAEILKAKREAAEAKLEESKEKQGGPESVEQRKARLLAQRDLLRQAKQKERADELQEFNAKTKTQDNLFEELKKMDQNKQLPSREDDEASEIL